MSLTSMVFCSALFPEDTESANKLDGTSPFPVILPFCTMFFYDCRFLDNLSVFICNNKQYYP